MKAIMDVLRGVAIGVANIIPGVSGGTMAVSMGVYDKIIGAVSGLFKHFKQVTLAALTGFMLGSLNKIWPWKETLRTYTDSHGAEHALTQRNLLPGSFETLTGADNQLGWAILWFAIGFVLIFSIEYINQQLKKRNPK